MKKKHTHSGEFTALLGLFFLVCPLLVPVLVFAFRFSGVEFTGDYFFLSIAIVFSRMVGTLFILIAYYVFRYHRLWFLVLVSLVSIYLILSTTFISVAIGGFTLIHLFLCRIVVPISWARRSG